MMEYMHSYPFLKPLFFVVKYYLYQQGLNEPYSGGMGSYALILMMVSFFQQLERIQISLKKPDLGVLLVDFLYFYGTIFDYSKGISVKNGGSYFKKLDHAHFSSSEQLSLLCIEDPNDSTNNVARATYQMNEIKSLFKLAYHRLSNFRSATTEIPTPLSTILSADPRIMKERVKLNSPSPT
jgi:non-canonical poly(A) RNA polymerase PAPD5/7